MDNNNEKPRAPRPFTEEEKELLRAHIAEHNRKMATDPEYRKRCEEFEEKHKHIHALLDDTF